MTTSYVAAASSVVKECPKTISYVAAASNVVTECLKTTSYVAAASSVVKECLITISYVVDASSVVFKRTIAKNSIRRNITRAATHSNVIDGNIFIKVTPPYEQL